MTTEADQIDQLLETLRRDCLPAGGADLISAYVSSQREALAQVHAELAAKPADDLAKACIERLIESGAENYLEHHFVFTIDGEDAARPATVTVQFKDRPSPHQLRIQAEEALARVEAELNATDQKLLAKTGAHEFVKHGVIRLVTERETAQAQLGQLQAETQDLRANMTKALDLLDVLTSTKYTDQAFVEAVDEADEMLEQLRGKVALEGLAEQQKAQDAQAVDFQREDRYIVIKRKDLALLSPTDRDLALTLIGELSAIMETWNSPKREYLVIEGDWPEYEPTWAAIQARVTGQCTQVEDEREAFSSWAHEKGFCLDCAFFEEGNNFEDPDTRLAYEIWLARAAIATRPAVRGVEHE